MKRHSDLERKGIHQLGALIEGEFQWIFREQQTVDVGIDVIIERSIEGEPTGNFLAIQLKAGEGNAYKNAKGYTYYISNVHKAYWLNLDLPIILIIYNPSNNCFYWEVINNKTVLRTEKRWKIVVSHKKTLCAESKESFNNIIDSFIRSKSYFDRPHSNSFYEVIEDAENIILANESMNNICAAIKQLGNNVSELNIKIHRYNSQGLTLSSPQQISALKKLSSILQIFNSRISTEIPIYVDAFTTGTLAFKNLALPFLTTFGNENEDFKFSYSSFKNMIPSFDVALCGLSKLEEGLEKLPLKNSNFKSVKRTALEYIKTLIIEIQDSKTLSKEIENSIYKATVE